MEIRVGILTAPHIDFAQRERSFLLRNVRIGIGFHWDRLEDQEFAGKLEILHNADGTETAVNIIDLEQYLESVISSEMSADSPMELLKAHAIISRGWAMRAIEANRVSASKMRSAAFESNGHVGFDVCADDHCQRYEGLRRMNERAVQAVLTAQDRVPGGAEHLIARVRKGPSLIVAQGVFSRSADGVERTLHEGENRFAAIELPAGFVHQQPARNAVGLGLRAGHEQHYEHPCRQSSQHRIPSLCGLRHYNTAR